MRRATIAVLALTALTACGKKGARGSDFDSATAAALASGSVGTAVADLPKIGRVMGFTIGHGLDRHDMIFGGPATQFTHGDSVLVSVRTQYVPAGTDVSARIRLKNATIDSTGAKSGAPDTASVSYAGLRFGNTTKWVKGNYQVEVFLNGKYQVGQEFTIAQ
jgi:hypothetical protein